MAEYEFSCFHYLPTKIARQPADFRCDGYVAALSEELSARGVEGWELTEVVYVPSFYNDVGRVRFSLFHYLCRVKPD